MIDLAQISRHTLRTEPFTWTTIDHLFSPEDAAALASSYPCDHYKTIMYYGEREYEYDARSLIGMEASRVSYPEELSPVWTSLAQDLLSPAYRKAMSQLTGLELTTLPVEVNVFHYGPGANLGPHPDLADKVVTHVLYFNRSWDRKDGGCLAILRSSDPNDIADIVDPIVGNSAVIVRSDTSWHAVQRVVNDSRESRRSMTVTFYRPGSVSPMWPPNDATPLHRYEAPDLNVEPRRPASGWRRWQQKLTRRMGMF